jgi:hypothetical protein
MWLLSPLQLLSTVASTYTDFCQHSCYPHMVVIRDGFSPYGFYPHTVVICDGFILPTASSHGNQCASAQINS